MLNTYAYKIIFEFVLFVSYFINTLNSNAGPITCSFCIKQNNFNKSSFWFIIVCCFQQKICVQDLTKKKKNRYSGC